MSGSRFYRVTPDAKSFVLRWLRALLGAGAAGILPATVKAQVVEYTATLNSGLQSFPSWQSAIWSINPAGGSQPWPRNSPISLYSVLVPTAEAISLTDDVTISAMRIDQGLAFQNSSSHTLTVLGNFELRAGALMSMNALNLILEGDSRLSGRIELNSGSSLLNYGNLVLGPDSASIHSLFNPTLTQEYDFLNAPAGTVEFSRPGGVTLQDFRFLNTGSVQVQGSGTVDVRSSYTQTAGVTRITDGNTLKSNKFSFSGGAIFGAGNALDGKFSITGTTIEVGSALNEVAVLTLTGNIEGPMTGTSLVFDLGGTVAGVSHDQLVLPEGDFDGVTLSVDFVNGFQNSILNTDSFTVITGKKFSGTFANQVGNILPVPGFGYFLITTDSNTVVLSGFIPVPEPGSMVLAALGLLGFPLRRRRLT